jgi:uncharacterized protein
VSPEFLSAMAIGFLGGGHCLGMCGGIVSAVSLTIPRNQSVTLLNLGYNFGRILSYIIAGFLAGSIGLLLINTAGGKGLQLGLDLIAALFIIALGLYLSGILNVLKFTENLGAKLWQFIEPVARKFYPFQTLPKAIIAGILWGYIPCGMVYGMLAWAVTSADPATGAWYMLGFGIGTLPNLLAIGIFANKVRPILNNSKIKLVAGLAIVAYGVYRLVLNLGLW